MTDPRPPLHVLMLLDAAYPPLQGGGTEMQVRTLSRALRARGHRVTVLAPLTPGGVQQRAGRLDGVPVCRLPYPRLHLVGGVWLMIRLFLFLISRRDRYDAWHVHSPRRLGAVAALLGSWLAKPQVVVKVASATEFESGTLAPRPSALNRSLYLCLRRADAWQAISGRIGRALAARGIPPHRIAAIPNAVDLSRFNASAGTGSEHPRFVFIGRLVTAKNLFMLLEAFAELLRVHPGAQLRIVGGGPLEAALKQRAHVLDIESGVEFTGHRSDVERLLADADFGVLPSTVEGLSNTLLECMASGLPMIASRISGSEDLVRTGINGWLFEPGDRAELTRCLIEAASLAPQRRRELGEQARAAIERHASLDSVLERMLPFYRGAPTAARSRMSAASERV
ncbi:glycosyltransferase family 4 protein [Lysobacter sp. D1-1-M9]|uniref:glycosyltransferase family 4 protein n=2 Tax=Novilysobacter TaxID=3382699 RepID=UPI002FC83CCB